LLRTIRPDEIRGQPLDPLVVAAGEIADARSLDLDDAGAEVRQVPRADGCCDRVFERENGQAVEWSHELRIPAGCTRPTACRTVPRIAIRQSGRGASQPASPRSGPAHTTIVPAPMPVG